MDSHEENGIKIFYPSLKEMKNFNAYMEQIEEKCKGECAAKIIPPDSFTKHPSKRIPNNYVLKNVSTISHAKIQSGNDCMYELSYKQSSKKYMNFHRSAEIIDYEIKSDSEIEDLVSKWIDNDQNTSEYSLNNSTSLFNDKIKHFNLSKLTKNHSLIHDQKFVKPLEGITTPFVYIGLFMTFFGFHLEDANLNSINYLHRGAPKVWYFVPESENSKLEKLVNRLAKTVGNITCSNIARHKDLMIPPSVLRRIKSAIIALCNTPNNSLYHFPVGIIPDTIVATMRRKPLTLAHEDGYLFTPISISVNVHQLRE